MARVVAASFARREPQSRHLRPPKYPPAALMAACHTDPFGTDRFGAWTTERLLYWFIRLFLLTDPTSPGATILLNEDGQVIGGSLNETMPPLDAPGEFREYDPFLAAAFAFVEPVFDLLGAQDPEALAKADTFELVAASAEHYRALGYAFMVVEATNQWTGAASEALGGVRVHFAPFPRLGAPFARAPWRSKAS